MSDYKKTNDLTEKTTPVDADLLRLDDSADSFAWKKATIANVSSKIQADLMSNDAVTTIASTDTIPLLASGENKIISEANLSAQVQADMKAADNTFTGTNVFPTMNVGDSNTISGINSTAEGNSTTASGYVSHAEGNSTTASGESSHAEGSRTTASGNFSHAEGNSTTASGDNSHAEGFGTTASGESSHAEGNSTTASGYVSHAEGNSTTASGNFSHAEGAYTTASGDYSHAEGAHTTAYNNYSHASGYYSTARLRSQHAQANGRFAATGDSQRTSSISHKETTDATPIECLTSTNERYVLPAGYIMACTVTINGSNADGSVAGFYKRQAYIKNVAGAVALIGSVQTIGTDIEIGAIGGVAVTADDTNDSLLVTVTGKADETIRWVCVIDAVEVGH